MSLGLALSLLDAAADVGGGTFYADGEPFTRQGFVVGGKAPSLVIRLWADGRELFGPASVESVAKWIEGNRSRMYGSWLDEGSVHIDAVDVYDDRDQAIEVGRLRGELAIYDMAAGADIRLDGGVS